MVLGLHDFPYSAKSIMIHAGQCSTDTAHCFYSDSPHMLKNNGFDYKFCHR